MPDPVVQPLHHDPAIPSDVWVLVLGGVTRSGNRRARRFVQAALGNGKSVVWLDGFEEAYSDKPNTRVPLDTSFLQDQLTIVGYSQEESRLIVNRIRLRLPGIIYNIGSQVAELLGRSSNTRIGQLGRTLRRIARRLGTFLHDKLLNRGASVIRGYRGYKTVQPWLESLARGSSPELIVYCDDFALTIAWHAAQAWPDTPIDNSYPRR